MAAAERIVGLLLAGGASSRLGRDKARLPLPGSRTTLAENACRILEEAGLEVVVAARDRERAELLLPGRRSVDDGPGRGPAAALLGAHAAFPEATLIALACDMPLVPPGLLRLLAEVEGDWVVPAWAAEGTLTPLHPSPEDGKGKSPNNPSRGFAPPARQSGESGEIGEPEGGTPFLTDSPPSRSAERGAGRRGPALQLEPLCALYRPAALAALARRVAAGRLELRGLAEEEVVVRWLDAERIAEFGDPAAIFRNINEERDLDAFAALRQAPPCRLG